MKLKYNQAQIDPADGQMETGGGERETGEGGGQKEEKSRRTGLRQDSRGSLPFFVIFRIRF